MSQKPKKINLKIESCADFPEKNCFVVFEIDGKQVGKSKELVQIFLKFLTLVHRPRIFSDDQFSRLNFSEHF